MQLRAHWSFLLITIIQQWFGYSQHSKWQINLYQVSSKRIYLKNKGNSTLSKERDPWYLCKLELNKLNIFGSRNVNSFHLFLSEYEESSVWSWPNVPNTVRRCVSPLFFAITSSTLSSAHCSSSCRSGGSAEAWEVSKPRTGASWCLGSSQIWAVSKSYWLCHRRG